MKKKHIIIIGSDGFIGKNLFKKLSINKDYNIEKISKKNYGDIFKNLNWFKKIKKDKIIYLLAFENNLTNFDKNYEKILKK